MHIYALITLLFCYINLIACAPSDASSLSEQHQQRLTGRSPKYDFGLGKRRYILRTSESGSKRMPHYDFGLGKRSVYTPYSFGLGKRADYYDEEPYGENLSDDSNDYEIQALRAALEAKRSRQYSFGLGKRNGRYDFGLGKKRSNEEYDKRLPNRYNFGLGRR